MATAETIRPIIVNSYIYKILEAYCLQDLLKYPLHNNQFGFRKNLSIEQCKSVVFDKIYQNKRENHKEQYLFFIDFKNAYNSINRNKLYKILETWGHLPQHKLEIIKFLHYNNKIRLG